MGKAPLYTEAHVLVIGGGGREHALAWKLARSPRVARVFVAPGNGGTDTHVGADLSVRPSVLSCATHSENVQAGRAHRSTAEIRNTPDVDAQDALIAFARREEVGLIVVGPEAALADGVVDACTAAGLRCFGPTQAAARLETSKRFAKDFMARHGIPSARYAAFTDYDEALAYLRAASFEVVVKASGLAAGKGVIVPASGHEAEVALRQIMVERAFGAAGDEVVIEERLYGQEVSVLAFSDGRTVALMPAAQDHKAAYDGDLGPNTGGMGAYAPAPLLSPALAQEVRGSVLQAAVDGLREEGITYVGVLYAGLMLTDAGPRVLEFNCRFGDPETQAILPLLESDLVLVLEACLDGTLNRAALRWRSASAATVVAASEGYPGSYARGREITGVAQAAALPGVSVFQAGTRRADDGRLLTDGGRVLAVTGVGRDLPEAIGRAYDGMGCIHFDGMHFRHDIGAKALTHEL